MRFVGSEVLGPDEIRAKFRAALPQLDVTDNDLVSAHFRNGCAMMVHNGKHFGLTPSGVAELPRLESKVGNLHLYPDGLVYHLKSNQAHPQGFFAYQSPLSPGQTITEFQDPPGHGELLPSPSAKTATLSALFGEVRIRQLSRTAFKPIKPPSGNKPFTPISVAHDGTIVGCFGTGVVSPDPFLQDRRYGEPAFYEDGSYTALPVPSEIEESDPPKGTRIILKWNKTFFAESIHFGTQESVRASIYSRFWIYKDEKWIEATPENANTKNGNERFRIADYDLTTGRILIANLTDYKVIQL